MTISLTDLLTIASTILSVVALLITIIGFFASLKFYRDGIQLQDSATKALAKIEEKTTTIGQQVTGIFDKAFDAAISKGGQINQDFADINEQIEKAGKALLEKTTTELNSISLGEKEKLRDFISEQLKNITDQVIVTQENANEIVTTPDNEFIAISQFQAKILETLRASSDPMSIDTIADTVGFSVSVVEKAVFRLTAKRLIISNHGLYSINEHKVKHDLSLIDRAFQSAADGDKQVLLAKLGIHLQKLNPSFDARAYGYVNLSDYLKAQDGYSLIDNVVNGYNHPIVIKK